MKFILTVMLLVICSTADAQLIIRTGVGRAEIDRIDRRVEEQQQRIDQTNERLERIEASIEALLQIKSPPPIGETVVKKSFTAEAKPQETGAYPSKNATGGLWYPNGGRHKWTGREDVIQHLLTAPEHKGDFTRQYLESLSMTQLEALHADDHTHTVRWQYVSGGKLNQEAIVKTGHWENRRFQQCTKNGCVWVTEKVWVED